MRRRGRDMLANPHITHGMVSQALPALDRERTLWRFDYQPGRAHLVALTQSRPSWAHVIEVAGWEGADGSDARVFDLEPLLAMVALGRMFAFKARLNPVYSTQDPQGNALKEKLRAAREERDGRVRGVKVPARTARFQTEWFLKQTKKWGFEIPLLAGSDVPDVILNQRQVIRFTKGRGSGPLVTLSTATFTGNLIVTDVGLFRSKIVEGIGRGKAYGCGLLTLGPPAGNMSS
jgi:CRISPR system Cascade subunit CasE